MGSLRRKLKTFHNSNVNRAAQASHRNRLKKSLRFEQLEDRRLLAGDVSISVLDGSLNEVGSPSGFVATGSGGLDGPRDIVVGPDGNLYVPSSATHSVIRYSGTTGQLLGTFIGSGSGGLSGPFGLAFGPDGNLYVGGGQATSFINRYHGATGAFLNTFVTSGSGGLNQPAGFAFGPDGNLYVSSRQTDSVMRYQGPLGLSPGDPLPAGQQLGATFVEGGSGGLDTPIDLAFGPDGHLYVGSTLSASRVLRFDGSSGSFLGPFVPTGDSLGEPRGLAFDADGRLYVADHNTNAVRRYDSQGNHIDDLVPPGSGSVITRPFGIAFDAIGNLLIADTDTDAVLRYSSGVLVTLQQASSNIVSVGYSTAGGTAAADIDYTSQSGTVTFAPGQTARRVLLAAHDDLLTEASEAFTFNLSNPSPGATLADGNATVTITDDDSVRQIIVGATSVTEGNTAAHYRGAFIETLPINNYNGLTFGPDGYLYTSLGPAPTAGPIDRYDGTTGAFVDHFIPGGIVNGVRDKVFHAGFLYIGSEYTDEVVRFNASTGAFDRAFVEANASILDGPHGVTFGPDLDGDLVPELFVTGRNSQNVVRYNGATGVPELTFSTTGSGALSWPEGLTIGPDGVVYVASTGSNKIQKYNPTTGAYLGAITSSALVGPKDVKFGSDGLIYVASSGNDRILRFAPNGSYLDDFVPAGAGGIDNPYRIAFGPDGDLYVAALGVGKILRFGTQNEAVFTVSISSTSSLEITVDFTTANGSATAPSDYKAVSGTVTFTPGTTSRTILVSIEDDIEVESPETFSVGLTNPVGAVIVVGQGIGTILDNDVAPTKFYVVNDALTNRTYEYDAAGGSIENYSLNSGNSSPRGAASTAAGDRLWVADKNRKVYVYNPSGGLLGSWSAGTLASNATVEGIATNGTDVWIVDSKSDKVYFYSGAASRTSGSQNATSFSLNSGNTSPKGIVTDGAYLWVVNDSSTDKVFKYTIGGLYVGSWTIDSANKLPTGLTIDPSNGSQSIWIVDSGTDKVYEYAGARTRTSGIQSASSTFALAAGNSNPQGIADPPPRLLSSSGTGKSYEVPLGDAEFAAYAGAALLPPAIEMPKRPLTIADESKELGTNRMRQFANITAGPQRTPEGLQRRRLAADAADRAVVELTEQQFDMHDLLADLTSTLVGSR